MSIGLNVALIFILGFFCRIPIISKGPFDKDRIDKRIKETEGNGPSDVGSSWLTVV